MRILVFLDNFFSVEMLKTGEVCPFLVGIMIFYSCYGILCVLTLGLYRRE